MTGGSTRSIKPLVYSPTAGRLARNINSSLIVKHIQVIHFHHFEGETWVFSPAVTSKSPTQDRRYFLRPCCPAWCPGIRILSLHSVQAKHKIHNFDHNLERQKDKPQKFFIINGTHSKKTQTNPKIPTRRTNVLRIIKQKIHIKKVHFTFTLAITQKQICKSKLEAHNMKTKFGSLVQLVTKNVCSWRALSFFFL